MSVNNISEILAKICAEEDAFPFLYQRNNETFIPGKSKIFYSGPYWDDEELTEGLRAFITGKWLASGEKVSKFEKDFSKRYNLKSSLMVNSGSSANLVMITALKKYFSWEDQAEIIVSPVGFPTTVAPLVQNNLKPIFVDIDLSDLNFNLDQVEAAITKKTKAIFISPVLGNPPDIARLVGIAKDHKIELIMDGCDSLGSQWEGRDLSDYAFSTSCSFYPAHHITTGEGGMVSSNDTEFINLCRSLAWWGRDCYCVGKVNLTESGACGKRFDKWIDGYDEVIDHKYLFTSIGYNLKPLDFQGAIGSVQLTKVDEIHDKRIKHKNIIAGIFEDVLGDWVRIPTNDERANTSWFGVPIICQKNKLKGDLVQFLESNNIQTRNYFAGNLLRHPAYKHLDDYKKYPNSNIVLDQVFFLGCHPGYTAPIFEYIEATLKKFKESYT
jgi:CDP-6-deoxy-D-xylo-4-hexulose-3-dehydrase